MPAGDWKARRLFTKDRAKEEGVIEAVLPNAMYRVRLNDGRAVRAALSPAMRHATVRLIGGSRVKVELSSRDPGRGRITQEL
jgi:translation initiation factor IF-1